MRSIRALIATGVITALALSSLAAPAVAGTGARMTIVNGIAGKKIDVCIGSTKELRSGLKYGGVYKKGLTGSKKLRFRTAGRGTCKGKVLAGRNVTFPAGSDKTIVVTAKSPKVLVFGNPTTVDMAGEGRLALRHAADLSWNTVHFRRGFWKVVPEYPDLPFEPTLAVDDPEAFEKGSQYMGKTAVNPDFVVQVKVTRPDPAIVLATSPVFQTEALKRYEFIFVGTKAKNARLVQVTTDLPEPPPAA